MAQKKGMITQFQLGCLNIIYHLDRSCYQENEEAWVRSRGLSILLDTRFTSYHQKELRELTENGWLKRRAVGKVITYEYALTERARAWFAARFASACQHVILGSRKTLFE